MKKIETLRILSKNIFKGKNWDKVSQIRFNKINNLQIIFHLSKKQKIETLFKEVLKAFKKKERIFLIYKIKIKNNLEIITL